MEYFTSLSESQIVGIILPLAVLPFLSIALRRWWWAKQSVHWPKTKGIIVKGIAYRVSRSLDFLYTYDVNGISYEGDKSFFYNSYKTVNNVSALVINYTEGKQVVVYYNPLNHKISTLVPGKKQGVINVFIFMLSIFIITFLSFFFPVFFKENLAKFFTLFN